MTNHVPQELQHYRKVKESRRNLAIAKKCVPAAQDTFLDTRGYETSGDTLALNVFNYWKENDIDPNTAKYSKVLALNAARELFPGCDTDEQLMSLWHWHLWKERQRKASERKKARHS